MAACLLIGASVYWLLAGGGGRQRMRPATGPVAADAAKRSTPESAAARWTAGDLRWDDSLDRRIAQAGQDAIAPESDLAHCFETVDLVRYRLQQAQEDLETSKL